MWMLTTDCAGRAWHAALDLDEEGGLRRGHCEGEVVNGRHPRCPAVHGQRPCAGRRIGRKRQASAATRLRLADGCARVGSTSETIAPPQATHVANAFRRCTGQARSVRQG